MKKICIAILFMSLFGHGINAQDKSKLGHINTTELITAMPETKAADTELKEFEQTLTKSLETFYKEYEQMIEDYKNSDTLPDFIKKAKEDQILQKQKILQEFDAEIPSKLQEKRLKLYTPILDKAKEAINAVSKENGYTYVMDSSQGLGLLYFENGNDLMDKVKAKLGITKEQ